MSLVPILRYSLDLSGISPNNLVVGELHHLPAAAPNRAIAPYYGSFYTQGLKVRSAGGVINATADTNTVLTGTAPLIIGLVNLGVDEQLVKRVRLTNQTNINQNGLYTYTVTGGQYTLTPASPGNYLIPVLQFVPTMLNQDATRESGLEVCDLIVITDPSITDDLILEYQAVGGDFSVSSDALEQLITTLQLDHRPVRWGEIIGLPTSFPPSGHTHNADQDLFGMGPLVDALEGVRQALLMSNGGGGGGGGSGTGWWIGTTPPSNHTEFPFWWNPQELTVNAYYTNLGGTPFWVEIANASGGGGGAGGSGGVDLATFNALQAQVNSVSTTATNAASAASSAQTIANSAASDASTALSTANSASTAAGNAATAASNALTAANSAASAASTAATAAATAQTTAENARLQSIIIPCSNETDAIIAANGVITIQIPYPFKVNEVKASLTVAQTSGLEFTVNIKNNGVSIFSTPITIDNSLKNLIGTSIPPVLANPNLVLAEDSELTVDITQVGDGTAKGLKLTLLGYIP